MHLSELGDDLLRRVRNGLAIPAHPLALDSQGRFDENRQRALTRYYLEAGAGGIAVAVHTTQFAVRDPSVGLFEPVLALAAETARSAAGGTRPPPLLVAGACGDTAAAVREASVAASLGYHAVLLNLAALADAGDGALVAHCREVSRVLPLFGFYLQPAAGGRRLGYRFWELFCAIENVLAIKVAPFNRYATLDVARAVAASGRDREIALYTGNDDNIVADLVTPFQVTLGDREVPVRFVGGLLGHWAVWTRRAAWLFGRLQDSVASGYRSAPEALAEGVAVTDANAALFDAANHFAGCIAGVQHVLHQQGLLTSPRCLDPDETMSPGQAEEIGRVMASYPHLDDSGFIAENLDRWMR